MPQITRNTAVVSFSIDTQLLASLDGVIKSSGLTRSATLTTLINQYVWWERWKKLCEYGRRKAKKFGFTSEEDVYKFLGDA